MNNEYETGNSSVKISDGAKGSTVEVKVYAKSVPEDENVAKIVRGLPAFVNGDKDASMPVNWHSDLVQYINHLRSRIPDMDAAQELANQLHLKTAAKVEKNGGVIVYDPEQRLLAAWNQMVEHDAASA